MVLDVQSQTLSHGYQTPSAGQENSSSKQMLAKLAILVDITQAQGRVAL